MADERFIATPGRRTLGDIAALTGAALADGSVADRTVSGLAPLESAGPEHLSFLDNRRYHGAFRASRAGACLVRPADAGAAPAGMAVLVTDNPYLAWALAARALYPRPEVVPGVAALASVDGRAHIDPSCRIEAGAVVGPGAELGPRCLVAANAVIGAGVVVGAETVVGAGASLAFCLVGARCAIHEGARIDSEGFGFASDGGRHLRIPHVGRVVIGDDVEIGANTTVDRGTVGDTAIGPGTMIDNLVQIAHNVTIGRGCVIAGQVGIAGSTVLGDYVVIGGQAGLAGHLTVGAGAVVAARSAVKGDLAPGGTYAGTPAIPISAWRRQMAAVARLGRRTGESP
ncbi:MAG: UDP-3-O-(3-hydroxymyristoyl)glucosamine N-acyltransferase [Alphaproteobacteria bacterium]